MSSCALWQLNLEPPRIVICNGYEYSEGRHVGWAVILHQRITNVSSIAKNWGRLPCQPIEKPCIRQYTSGLHHPHLRPCGIQPAKLWAASRCRKAAFSTLVSVFRVCNNLLVAITRSTGNTNPPLVLFPTKPYSLRIFFGNIRYTTLVFKFRRLKTLVQGDLNNEKTNWNLLDSNRTRRSVYTPGINSRRSAGAGGCRYIQTSRIPAISASFHRFGQS